jgi:hypothetical protein
MFGLSKDIKSAKQRAYVDYDDKVVS